MKKILLLVLFVLFNNKINSQKYVIGREHLFAEYNLENYGFLNLAISDIAQAFDQGKDIKSFSKEERFCLYISRYFNDRKLYFQENQMKLISDIDSIFIFNVGLDNVELKCLKTKLFFSETTYSEECNDYSEKILCKSNRYFFSLINKIFEFDENESTHKNNLSILNYSDEDGLSSEMVFGNDNIIKYVNLKQKHVTKKYFYNLCGILDSVITISNSENTIDNIKYYKNSERKWKGVIEYFSNGKKFSTLKEEADIFNDILFKEEIIYSKMGDTLSFEYVDYRGDVKDFIDTVVQKNINGKIININDEAIRVDYKIDNDSVLVYELKSAAYKNSIFYNLRKFLNIDKKLLFKLDSIFLSVLINKLPNSKPECIKYLGENLKGNLSEIKDDLFPFINVTCDMIIDTYNIDVKMDTNLLKQEYIFIYKYLNKKIQDKDLLTLFINFNNQKNVNDGEWLNGKKLFTHLKNKVSKEDLIHIYLSLMQSIIIEAKTINFANENLFIGDLNNLRKVVDTLGSYFIQLKKREIHDFYINLNESDQKLLDSIYAIYKKVVLNYYKELREINYERTYGTEPSRMKYYELITNWQLRMINERLFNQNKNEVLPERFYNLLKEFDNYLDLNKYSRISKCEEDIFKSMNGFNRFLMTPYNPYYGENEKQKRSLRRFNWLVGYILN